MLSRRSIALEARNAEPAGLRVIPRSMGRRNDVFDNLAAAVGGRELGLDTHTADEGQAREVAARRGAEGAEKGGRIGGGSESRAEGVEAEHGGV